MQFFIGNLKMKWKKDKKIDLPERDLNPRFSVIFPHMICIFMWAWDQIETSFIIKIVLLAFSWKNPLILFQCYEVHLTYDNQVSRRRRQSAVVMIIQSVTQNQVESCRQRRNWISHTMPPCTAGKNLVKKIPNK